MLKYIIIILLFSTLSWGCAVCKVQVPNVDVYIDETHNDSNITLNIIWKFQDYFSAETKLSYDENRNQILDPEEINTIHSNFIEYLEKEYYLTHIKYVKDVNTFEEANYLTFNIKGSQTEFIDDRLLFRYTLILHSAPRKDEVLYIKLHDDQRYFNFTISEIILQDKSSTKSIFKSGYSTLFVPFGDMVNISEDKVANIIEHSNDTDYEEEPEPEGFLGMLTVAMDTIKDHVLDLIEDIVMNESISSYIWLLFFSLIYGVIHALGPGHGKSLVAAYFLGNNRSTFKAFTVATLIGVVHTFSAFMLTFTLYYILNAYLSEYFEDLEYVTIKISAMIIIIIALYLLYKKLPKKQKQTPLWSSEDSTQHQSTCGCGACKNTSSDLGIILSAGIVPCPGTITIFVFSLSFGAYMVGFLSAIFMSLGMSLVIFLAALLSLKIRKNTSQRTKVRVILDYGSLLFIFLLGVILLVL